MRLDGVDSEEETVSDRACVSQAVDAVVTESQGQTRTQTLGSQTSQRTADEKSESDETVALRSSFGSFVSLAHRTAVEQAVDPRLSLPDP